MELLTGRIRVIYNSPPAEVGQKREILSGSKIFPGIYGDRLLKDYIFGI